MNRWTVLLATLSLSVLVAIGCSGGGDPVGPPAGPDLTANAVSHGTNSNTQLWGYYDFHINVDAGTVEFVPNRTNMWNANVVFFLNDNPANMEFTLNLLDIGIEDPEAILVDIDVTLNHPFPGMDQFNGYDVMGVFMGAGANALNYNPALKYPVYKVDQFMMDDPVNDDGGGPDGYTRWFNQPEFTLPGVLGFTYGNYGTKLYDPPATLCPYRYYADGINIEDAPYDFLTANAAEFGVFAAGSSNTRNYYLEFPFDILAPAANYQYAVVASWEDPEIHPSNTTEALALSITTTPDIWYEDGTGDSGGILMMDIDVWAWNEQPSTVIIEAPDVLSINYEGATQTGGGANFSTWHVEVPADNLSYNSSTGNDAEFWVICEYAGYDYNSEFTGGANPTDALASFFRYNDLYIKDGPYCMTEFVAIDPESALINTLVNATVTVTELEDGPDLDCYMTMVDETIQGTNIVYVDETTLTCDFDLNGVTDGLWDVHVMNGCGGTEGVGIEAFEVIPTTGWALSDDGDLPTPLPHPDEVNFGAVGNAASGFNNGLYYFGNNYEIMYYPLDYSSAGTSYMTMQGNYGYPPSAWWGAPNELGSIECDGTGGTIVQSHSTNAFFGGYQARQCASWFAPNTPAASNGLTLNGVYGNVQFRDVEAEFGAYSPLWGHWATYYDYNYAGNDVEIVMVGVGYAYGSGSYTTGWGINWGPLDESAGGSLDGEVSNIEQFRLAMDSDPQGLSGYDVIFYYLEGYWDATYADDPTIEGIANIKSSLGAAAYPLVTIDETNFEGVPIDICVFEAYGNVTGATGNWIVALEDNEDGTFQFASWTQDGDLTDRESTHDGTPIVMDIDNDNQEVHIWVDDAGTLRWYIFVWNE